MAEPLVKVVEVSKAFGAVRALRAVSCEVVPGTIHGLVGQNGAGKSTLLNVLAGLVEPDEGRIELAGDEIKVRSPEHAKQLGIATIHQELHLVGRMTVAENLALGSEPRKPFGLLDRAGMAVRARRALARLGRDEIPVTALVGELTIGNQQLVEIAKALHMDARLLILDEPTSALSSGAAEQLMDVLRRYRADGGTAIYVSHRFYEVLEICDRVSVLRDGQLIDTVDSASISEHELAELTVGRALSAVFPDRPPAPASAEPRPDPIVELRDVSGPTLDGLSLTIHPRRIMGVTGLEGSGIRELGRMLGGDVALQAGTIRIAGRTPRLASPRDAARAGVAYLSGNRAAEGLFPILSVQHNIAAPTLGQRRRLGFIDRQREARVVRQALEQFNVRARPNQPVSALSGGNQQKLLLARTLPLKPRLLVLDEPTRGVDMATRAEIYRELRELADSGAGVLVISTDIQEVAGLSDDVAVLRAGRVIAELQAPVSEAALARAVSTTTATAEPTMREEARMGDA